MAVPVILRGDDTAFRGTSLSVFLPEGDYAGLRVRFQLLGIVREWDSPAGGAELPIDLAAGETASLPLGTHFARLDVANYAGAGYVVSDTIRVRVTDDVADATGADNAIHVQPGGGGGFSPDLDGIDGDPATPDALKGAFSLLLERLRAAAGVFALLALASLSCGLLRAEGLEVQTAPLGGLPWATPVVTNVTGASGITTNDVRAIVKDKVANFDGNIVTSGSIRSYGDSVAGLNLYAISDGPGTGGVFAEDGVYIGPSATPAATHDDLAALDIRTNLPPVSASATVGELVDSINAVIRAMRKEDE